MDAELLGGVSVVSGQGGDAGSLQLSADINKLSPSGGDGLDTSLCEQSLVVEHAVALHLVGNLAGLTVFVVAAAQSQHSSVAACLVLIAHQILDGDDAIAVVGLVASAVEQVNLLTSVQSGDQAFLDAGTTLELQIDFSAGLSHELVDSLGDDLALGLGGFPVGPVNQLDAFVNLGAGLIGLSFDFLLRLSGVGGAAACHHTQGHDQGQQQAEQLLHVVHLLFPPLLFRLIARS